MNAAPLSEACVHGARATWPGAGATGGLILPLHDDRLLALPELLSFESQVFRRKREFHLTLLSRREREALDGHVDADELRRRVERQDWQVVLDGRLWLVERDDASSARTLIVGADAPGLVALRADLGLPPPTPHVTLYWLGDCHGIAVGDAGQWAERVRGEVQVDWQAGCATRAV